MLSPRNKIECGVCRSGYAVDIDTDRYCGYCGAPLVYIEAELVDKGPYYLDFRESIRVDVNVKNSGLFPADVTGFEVEIK